MRILTISEQRELEALRRTFYSQNTCIEVRDSNREMWLNALEMALSKNEQLKQEWRNSYHKEETKQDASQINALASWYTENNPLRLNPRHPLIKLAGESGELLDLFGKHEYKPGYDWMKKCECKHDENIHDSYGCAASHCDCVSFYPIVLSELGDCSYYLRILSFQQEVSFEILCKDFEPFTASPEELLNDLAYRSVKLHKKWLKFNTISKIELQIITFIFLSILYRLDVSLETILNLNYKKLNSEASQHGWSKAR